MTPMMQRLFNERSFKMWQFQDCATKAKALQGINDIDTKLKVLHGAFHPSES